MAYKERKECCEYCVLIFRIWGCEFSDIIFQHGCVSTRTRITSKKCLRLSMWLIKDRGKISSRITQVGSHENGNGSLSLRCFSFSRRSIRWQLIFLAYNPQIAYLMNTNRINKPWVAYNSWDSNETSFKSRKLISEKCRVFSYDIVNILCSAHTHST